MATRKTQNMEEFRQNDGKAEKVKTLFTGQNILHLS
jgi:hypothetical protein